VLRGSDARTCISTHTSPRHVCCVCIVHRCAHQAGAPCHPQRVGCGAARCSVHRRGCDRPTRQTQIRPRLICASAPARTSTRRTARAVVRNGEVGRWPRRDGTVAVAIAVAVAVLHAAHRAGRRQTSPGDAGRPFPHIRPLQHLDRAYTSIRSNFRDRRRRQT